MNPSRTEPFVPLVAASAAAGGDTEFRVKVIAGSDQAKPISAGARPAGGAAPAACAPRMTLQRNGDRVSVIRIECACGEVIELNCVYGPETR